MLKHQIHKVLLYRLVKMLPDNPSRCGERFEDSSVCFSVCVWLTSPHSFSLHWSTLNQPGTDTDFAQLSCFTIGVASNPVILTIHHQLTGSPKSNGYYTQTYDRQTDAQTLERAFVWTWKYTITHPNTQSDWPLPLHTNTNRAKKVS